MTLAHQRLGDHSSAKVIDLLKWEQQVLGLKGIYLSAHIPNTTHAVAPASHQDVQVGMQRQCINTTQVAMVMAYHLPNTTPA